MNTTTFFEISVTKVSKSIFNLRNETQTLQIFVPSFKSVKQFRLGSVKKQKGSKHLLLLKAAQSYPLSCSMSKYCHRNLIVCISNIDVGIKSPNGADFKKPTLKLLEKILVFTKEGVDFYFSK